MTVITIKSSRPSGGIISTEYLVDGGVVQHYQVSRLLTNTESEGNHGIFSGEDEFTHVSGARLTVRFGEPLKKYAVEDTAALLDTLLERARKVKQAFADSCPAFESASSVTI